MTQDARRAAEQPSVQADAKEILKDYYKDLSARVRKASSASPALRPFIRFAPFPAPIPGFTWLPTFLGRPLAEEMQGRVDEAHGEMRSVLFGNIDFRHVRRVLDIGCGYATDLIELAQVHGHLTLDGCNISEEQIDYGGRAIARAGLQGRIQLHHLDSSKNDFPGLYDLIVSHQVIHHIQDKDAVLRNIAEHLRKGGFLVAAEIISNLDERIDHDPSSAHFETRQNWAGLLANNQLRLARCVDASQEIANYLDDDNFARSVRDLAGNADESTVAHLHGPHSLGQLLRRGVASYLLLLVQRDYLSSTAALLAENRQRLEQPTPYADARRNVIAQADSAAAPSRRTAEVPRAQPPVAPPPGTAPMPAAPVPVATSGIASADASRESICKMVAQLLECAPESLDPEQALVAQGLNSILAMDLTRRLNATFGFSVTVKALLSGATIASLARGVPGAAAEAPVAAAAAAAPAEADLSGLLRSIGSMGEAEINRLLAQLERRREPSF